ASTARHTRVAPKVPPQNPVRFVTVETIVIVTFASQTSVAVGEPKLQGTPHSTTRLGTQVIVGGVVSMVVTVWLHRDVLVQASVASHVRTTSILAGHT